LRLALVILIHGKRQLIVTVTHAVRAVDTASCIGCDSTTYVVPVAANLAKELGKLVA